MLFMVFCAVNLVISPLFAESIGAKSGDSVQVYYSLSLPGGPVFESNANGSPLSFVLGSGAMILGFDRAIQGMIPGETKTVILSPDEAYGERNESLVQSMPLMEASAMLKGLNMSDVSISLLPGYPGPVIEYLPHEEEHVRYLITNITNETVTVDTNKPLAGHSLQFEITLNNITHTS